MTALGSLSLSPRESGTQIYVFSGMRDIKIKIPVAFQTGDECIHSVMVTPLPLNEEVSRP